MLWQCRGNSSRHCWRAGRGHLLVRWDSMARAHRYADQRFELGNHRKRCRAQSRSDPQNSEGAEILDTGFEGLTEREVRLLVLRLAPPSWSVIQKLSLCTAPNRVRSVCQAACLR